MTSTAGKPPPTVRLLASLLPATWPDRRGLLQAAERLDRHHGGDGSGHLLRAWARWRATGEVPSSPHVRDVLGALGALLGGLASEMRFRPRRHHRRPMPC